MHSGHAINMLCSPPQLRAWGQSRDGRTPSPVTTTPEQPLVRCPDPHVKWMLPPWQGEWVEWAWEWPNAKPAPSSCPSSWGEWRSKGAKSKGAKRAEEWETVRSERERCVWNGNAHFLRPHHPTGPQPPKPPKPPKTTQTTTRSEGAKKKALLVAYRALLSGRRRRLLNRTPNESFSPCFFVCGTIEFAIWCRQTTAALARRRGGLLFLAATPGAAIRLAHCHPPETPRPYGAPWSTATPRNVYNVWLCSWFN